MITGFPQWRCKVCICFQEFFLSRGVFKLLALLSFFLQAFIGCTGSTTGLKEQKHSIGLREEVDTTPAYRYVTSLILLLPKFTINLLGGNAAFYQQQLTAKSVL
ncbi:UNVERIFIED_CONTAM: hypothetical protein K2H54_042954 [Gekko kuhli]